MNALKTFFFDIETPLSNTGLFLKTIFFLLIAVGIIYLLYFAFSKFLYRGMFKENAIRLSFLWAIVAFLLIFCVYLFFLIRMAGLDAFHWQKWQFYVLTLPQWLVLIGTSLVFYILYSKSIKQLKPLNF